MGVDCVLNYTSIFEEAAYLHWSENGFWSSTVWSVVGGMVDSGGSRRHPSVNISITQWREQFYHAVLWEDCLCHQLQSTALPTELSKDRYVMHLLWCFSLEQCATREQTQLITAPREGELCIFFSKLKIIPTWRTITVPEPSGCYWILFYCIFPTSQNLKPS